MRLIKFIICFALFLNPAKSESIYGEGELKLSDAMVGYFLTYIQGKQFKYPSDFYVTLDGTDGTYWFCSEMTNCSPGSPTQDIKDCERKTRKKCKKFARKRVIKWKNGINPGKGKISQINSKLDLDGLKAKLTELGFYGNNPKD